MNNKRFIATILFIYVILCTLWFNTFTVSASTSGITGECDWFLDGTVLTISGNGAMDDYSYNNASPWGRTITKVIFENGVTNIGAYSFYECDLLYETVFCDSIVSIGENAFAGCMSLKGIKLPDNIKSIDSGVFQNCGSLNSIKLPNGITSIESDTFTNCRVLENIVIPKSVKSIGDYAFYCCQSLSSIDIPAGVSVLNRGLFANCNSLKVVNVPDSVINIYSNAFTDCFSLTEISLPDSIKEIGSSAFENCTSLVDIVIPDKVENIGYSLFKGCNSLKFISLPNSVKNIEMYAFSGCESLERVHLPCDVTNISSYSFYGCTSLKKLFIPKSLEQVNNNAFTNCNNLQAIFYEGTYYEWLKISNQLEKKILENAIIYFEKNEIPENIIFVSVSKSPNKAKYRLGENLDLSGGKIAVGYGEGNYRTFALTNDMVSGYDKNELGVQILTVTYKGYTDELIIEVFGRYDLDYDGFVNAGDIIILRRELLNDSGINLNYDINGDNEFNIVDLVSMKKSFCD